MKKTSHTTAPETRIESPMLRAGPGPTRGDQGHRETNPSTLSDATINLYSWGSNTISASMPLVLAGTNRVVGTGSLAIYSQVSGDGGLNLEGNVRLGGIAANTFSGPTRLSYGTLTLSKYFFILGGGFGVVAVPGALSLSNGEVLCVEDDNIADTSLVTLHAGTTLNLNGHTETIAGLSLHGGDVVTGAGTLTLGDDVSAHDDSTISGNLSLGGQSRAITVDANVRLDVWAHISNGGQKGGEGDDLKG